MADAVAGAGDMARPGGVARPSGVARPGDMTCAVVGLSDHRPSLNRLPVMRGAAAIGIEPVGSTFEEADEEESAAAKALLASTIQYPRLQLSAINGTHKVMIVNASTVCLRLQRPARMGGPKMQRRPL